MNRAIYARRRAVNGIFLVLSTSAAAIGIIALVLILYALIRNGVGGLSLNVFTMDTPAPGSTGGLANAIFGSLLMNAIGVLIGTPIGLLAGTYLAEYGRHSWLAFVIRFMNDILLSAPSIVIGLFVYEIIVSSKPDSILRESCTAMLGSYCPIGHFSGFAGSIALAVIVIPVVIRTTENMLLLVPNTLREAAASIGAPRAISIRAVTWRAARAGIMTGVLLAVARISGETAPLLFTAFGDQFWSKDLSQPMSSLPQVIFNFANSAYDDWHRLAWAGALLITATVLTLSIFARLLESRQR